ncbi:MAG TPA: HAD-IA family hydrolase [Bryobacteraceae bacterium]|nr:HAD-IA family hydrolase [Bryobacteraceae bacterium]
MDSLIVFDMDGVLADVTESYREAVVQTVKRFTGQTISRDLIQQYKNQGGWNNDWALSQKIAADLGVAVDYGELVDYFNAIFLGRGNGGLIERETWLPRPGLLERISKKYGMAIFTGRLRHEAGISLRRFASRLQFDPIVCADDVARGKPAPDGLLAIRKKRPGCKMLFVGDTVDDARSAGAAGVPFIGIASRAHSRREDLIRLFEQERAIAILDNVNEIEKLLDFQENRCGY